MTTVWRSDGCKSGYVLLGELSKYVATSSLRFGGLSCTAGGLSVTVHGTAGEVVPVTVLAKETVVVKTVTVPAAGFVRLSLP